jgi:hypothetical protein
MMGGVLPAGTLPILLIKTPFLALNQIPVQAVECGAVAAEVVRDVMYCLFVHCEVGSPYPISIFTHGSIWLLRHGKSTRLMLPFVRPVRLWSMPVSFRATPTPICPPFFMMILRTCGRKVENGAETINDLSNAYANVVIAPEGPYVFRNSKIRKRNA